MPSFFLQDEDFTGKDFDLAGDQNFTYKELLDFIFDITYQNPRVVDLPAPVAEGIAAVTESLMNPVLVKEDVRLWQVCGAFLISHYVCLR